MVEEHGGGKLLTSWQIGGRERDRKGPRIRNSSETLSEPPPNSLFSMNSSMI
jgi:hypothetical protein